MCQTKQIDPTCSSSNSSRRENTVNNLGIISAGTPIGIDSLAILITHYSGYRTHLRSANPFQLAFSTVQLYLRLGLHRNRLLELAKRLSSSFFIHTPKVNIVLHGLMYGNLHVLVVPHISATMPGWIVGHLKNC
jgi:hypothetical protein